VHFADHGIAAHASELRSDLAGAQAFSPQLLKSFDPLVSPVHARSPPLNVAGMQNPSTSAAK
jgi:hypothetical protein